MSSYCDGPLGPYMSKCPECGWMRVIHYCPDEWHLHLDDKECKDWGCP